MSDLDKERDEVKKNIRSLLLSAPVGLTLIELRNDYEEFMGSRLPARKFGFNSDEDFVRDLPDVVRITRKPDGELVLFATADESTQHIAKMVSKQKVDVQKWGATSTKKAKRGRSRGGGGARGRSQMGRPPYPGPRSVDTQQSHGQLVVPFFLRNKVKQFLEKYPEGVPLEHFEQAFYQKMGIRIEFEKLGFRGLNAFFAKIPDIARMSYLQHGEVRVAPVTLKRPVLAQKMQNVGGNNNQQPWKAQSSSCPPQSPSGNRNFSASQQQQQNLPSEQSSQQPTNQSWQQPAAVHKSASYPDRSSQSRGLLPTPAQHDTSSRYNNYSNNSNSGSSSKPALGRSSSYNQQQQLSISQMSIPASSPSGMHHGWEQATSQLQRPPEPEEAAGTSSTNNFLNLSSEVLEQTCKISPGLQNKVKEILLMRPKGLWASHLPFEFKNKYKTELPYREQDFSSVIEFISAMPHIARVERPNPKGDWLLFDATHPAEKDTDQLSDSSSLSTWQCGPQFMDGFEGRPAKQIDKDEQLKESVRQVLQAHTDGVSLFHFKEIYEEMTGLKLEPEQYGIKDVHTLLISLTRDVLRIEYRGQNISHLFALPSRGPCRFDFLLDCYKPHAVDPEDDDVYIDNDDEYDPRIPEGAVGPGVYYTPVPLPRSDLNSLDESVDVHVSYVISPGLFWVQRRGSLFNVALDHLMDSLEEVYKNRGDYYRMPESLMMYGQVCATLFPEDNNWHRGIIMGKNNAGMVEVYYVDYGNTCYVPQSSIRFLKKRFLKLPAQAIQARMAHVQPVGGEWSVGAKEEMLNIVRAKPMVALITNIQRRVLSLCLTDTTGKADVHLNDLMVERGYGYFKEDVYSQEPAHLQSPHPVEQQSPAPDRHNDQPLSITPVSPVSSIGHRYVRQIDVMSDIGFHLINLQGSLYVMSSEVSALFWEDDILCSMLQQSNFNLSKLVVTQDQYPALFQELMNYGVPNVGPSTKVLSLYSFTGLPLILQIFGNGSPAIGDLSEAIVSILQNFDPNDLYWKGHWEDSLSQQSESNTDPDTDFDDVLTMEELQMALRSLQVLRKRILKRMIVEAVCTPNDITELEEVEMKIKQAQMLIDAMESSLVTDVKLTADVGFTAGGAVIGQSCGTKSGATLPKSHFSTSTDPPLSTFRTNIVAPMIQPPTAALPVRVTPSIPAQGQVTHGLTLQGQTPLGFGVQGLTNSVVHIPGHTTSGFSIAGQPGVMTQPSMEQMVATNCQMEEIIKQQDQMLQSMLNLGWDPRLLTASSVTGVPSSTPTQMPAHMLATVPSLGLESLRISDVSQQPQNQAQFPSMGYPFPAPGMVNPCMPGIDPSLMAPNPSHTRMPLPPPHSSAGQVGGYQPVQPGVPPPHLHPFLMSRLPVPSLLRQPSAMSLGSPFSPANSTGMPLPPPPFQAPLNSLQPSLNSFQPQHASFQPAVNPLQVSPNSPNCMSPNSAQPPVLGAQNSALGRQGVGKSILRAPGYERSGAGVQTSPDRDAPGVNAFKSQAIMAPRVEPEGAVSFQPAAVGVAGGGLARGRLLPGMLPLLQSLKASCAVRPSTPTATSAQPPNAGLNQ